MVAEYRKGDQIEIIKGEIEQKGSSFAVML
jgi:hypothetical protein